MKLSLKVEYACRVLAQLARTQGTNKLAHIEELAQAESIPANYLVQILNELRNGGLINSKRGKQGGYSLARTPDSITLCDIVAIIDSDMLEAQLSTDGQSGKEVAKAWREIGQTMEERMREISLVQLMPSDSNMYYI